MAAPKTPTAGMTTLSAPPADVAEEAPEAALLPALERLLARPLVAVLARLAPSDVALLALDEAEASILLIREEREARTLESVAVAYSLEYEATSDETDESTELTREETEEPMEATSEVMELKPDRPLLIALPAAAVAVEYTPEAPEVASPRPEVTSLRIEAPREERELRSWLAPRVAAEATRRAVLTFILTGWIRGVVVKFGVNALVRVV